MNVRVGEKGIRSNVGGVFLYIFSPARENLLSSEESAWREMKKWLSPYIFQFYRIKNLSRGSPETLRHFLQLTLSAAVTPY